MWTEAARAAQRGREVDLRPLREAFLASRLSADEVARRLGWMRFPRRRRGGKVYGPHMIADESRVKRTLGLRVHKCGRDSKSRLRQSCSYEMALKLAEAIGVDPVDVGL
jgi:hypothetical protein